MQDNFKHNRRRFPEKKTQEKSLFLVIIEVYNMGILNTAKKHPKKITLTSPSGNIDYKKGGKVWLLQPGTGECPIKSRSYSKELQKPGPGI